MANSDATPRDVRPPPSAQRPPREKASGPRGIADQKNLRQAACQRPREDRGALSIAHRHTDGVTEGELEVMYENASIGCNGPTLRNRVEISKTEQSNGIFHRMRYGIIHTTYLIGQGCCAFCYSWVNGETFSYPAVRYGAALFLDTLRGCQYTQDGRVASHELGHLVSLQHLDCEDQESHDHCNEDGKELCTCGVDRTIEGKEWHTNDYTYYVSNASASYLSAPSGSQTNLGYVTAAGNCNYSCDEGIIPFGSWVSPVRERAPYLP
jgi:hypothetical protein